MLEIYRLNGGFLDVESVNFPSPSEMVPVDSPSTLIFAPGIGSFLLSFTEPETVV